MWKVNAMVERYHTLPPSAGAGEGGLDGVDFAVIYIEEAHASDEWPIYQVDIEQHKTLEARLGLAGNYHL